MGALIFNVLKENNCQLFILYPAKNPSKKATKLRHFKTPLPRKKIKEGSIHYQKTHKEENTEECSSLKTKIIVDGNMKIRKE